MTWLLQESMKFNKAQNLAVKQCQDKTRFLQKRQQENTARVARGEDPLPEEDVNKLFKPLPSTNRLNSLVLSGQINSTSHQVPKLCFS
jgi:translation initiation factor 3 subunit H